VTEFCNQSLNRSLYLLLIEIVTDLVNDMIIVVKPPVDNVNNWFRDGEYFVSKLHRRDWIL